MTKDELEIVWQALYRQEHYLMPFSTGEYMVYHRAPNRIGSGYSVNDVPHLCYDVIVPKKFEIKLFYEDDYVHLAKDKPFEKRHFVEIPMNIKLEDYFKVEYYRGRHIATALKRFELQYKVERLFSLAAFY